MSSLVIPFAILVLVIFVSVIIVLIKSATLVARESAMLYTLKSVIDINELYQEEECVVYTINKSNSHKHHKPALGKIVNGRKPVPYNETQTYTPFFEY